MYQKVIITGTLGTDPKAMNSNWTTFQLSAQNGWKTPDGKKQTTTWFTVNTYGPYAQVALKYLEKKSVVQVEGTIQPGPDGHPRTWMQDGQPRASYDIHCNKLIFLDGTKQIPLEPENNA